MISLPLSLAILCGWLAASPAAASEAEPAELYLYDSVILMEGAAYETGYLPSDDSYVGINFAIEANQYAEVGMEGLAHLTWPEALTLTWSGTPASGWMSTEAELATVITFMYDIWGYDGEVELDRRSLNILGDTTFDPLVLPDSSPAEVTFEENGEGMEAFDLSYTPFSGFTITVPVELSAYQFTAMAGLYVEQDDGTVLEGESDSVLLDVPDDGAVEIWSTYVAAWDSVMDLVITPSIHLELAGSYEYEVASFDIDVNMEEVSFEDPFDTVSYAFYLPLLDDLDDAHDFGEVAVGNTVNWDLALVNDGSLELEGGLEITGSESFTVYPESILAAEESEDGVVVSFTPPEAGEYEGTLILETNDPFEPTLEIDLTGSGIESEAGEEMTVIESEVGCGCASTRRRGAPALALLLLPLVIWRRERSHPSRSRT